MQAATYVLNRKIAALKKKIINRSSSFTSAVFHLSAMTNAGDMELIPPFRSEKKDKYPGDYIRSRDIYDDQLRNGQAEERIRLELDICLEILDKRYSYAEEEEAFLKGLPLEIEDILGLEYCLVRAYLGDFDYVKDYRTDKIKTIRPKRYADIDKVIQYFEISL